MSAKHCISITIECDSDNRCFTTDSEKVFQGASLVLPMKNELLALLVAVQ